MDPTAHTDTSTKQPPAGAIQTPFKPDASLPRRPVTSVGGRAPGLCGDADPARQTVPGTTAAAAGLVVRHPCSPLSRSPSLSLAPSALASPVSTSLALLLCALFAQLYCSLSLSPATRLSQMRPQLNLVICVHVCERARGERERGQGG